MPDLEVEQAIIDNLARGAEADPLTASVFEDLADLTFAFPSLLGKRVDQESFQVAMQVLSDDNGCRYFVADLPIQRQLVQATLGQTNLDGTAYQFDQLRTLAERPGLIANCYGVIIRSQPNSDSYAFKIQPGQVWALRQFGKLNPETLMSECVELIVKDSEFETNNRTMGGKVLVGAPSSDLIPQELRSSIRAQLKETLGIETPRVCVFIPKVAGVQPYIVYNYFPPEPVEKSPGYTLLKALHPPNYTVGVASIEAKHFERHMFEL